MEVIPVLMMKVKAAEVEAETKKGKAKMTEEITAAKMTFGEEMALALGHRNVKLEVMNHLLTPYIPKNTFHTTDPPFPSIHIPALVHH